MQADRATSQAVQVVFNKSYSLNAFWTTREGNPTASWEEIIGKAYQTRTQLAAFGFYNTSPLEYEYVTI